MEWEENKYKIVIVVTSYKRPDTLIKCLNHLQKIEKPKNSSIKTLVIDSGTEVNQLLKVRSIFKNVEFIQIKNNGYVGCINKGLIFAIGNGYDYMLLVTDDAFFNKDNLNKLIIPLDNDPNAAISGAKIIHKVKDAKGKEIVTIMSGAFLGEKIFSLPKKISNHEKEITKCDWVNGASLLYKISAFKKIGLLDESYFMYFDELSLGLKIKKAGFHALYIPDAIIIHESGSEFYGITSRNGKAYARYYLTRNVALLYYHMSPVKFLVFLPYYTFISVFRSLILFIKGRPRFSLAIIRGFIDFFGGNFGRSTYY